MKSFPIVSLAAVMLSATLTSTPAHAWSLYTGTGGAIPDFNPATAAPGVLTLTITVPDNILITDVNVTLTGLNHTWSGDMVVELQKVGGPTAMLVSRVGSVGGTFGASADYNGNYLFDSQSTNNIWDAAMGSPTAASIAAGTFTTTNAGTAPPFGAANNALNAFNGLNSAGQWKLIITDTKTVDTGSITGWSLTIVPAPGAIALLATAAVVAVRRRRR